MEALKIPSLGEIITFYSYKGGTGRSMALSNVAYLLAEGQSQGKGVLMIDWDLEAPGLHKYFYDKFTWLSATEFEERPGLIDLFLKLNSATPKTDFSSQEEAEKIANDALDSIKLEQYIIETDIPYLSLLKAGYFNKDYSHRVSNFDWEDLYNRSPLLIRLFAKRLSEQYKYILIDSRTGYTDIGGICTMLMPQKLVVVFTPNRQNYDGIIELIKKATEYRRQSRDLRPLLVYPLPTRIESSRDDLRAEWRLGGKKLVKGYQPMFEELFSEIYDISNCNLEKYFDEVQIQHSPNYAYGEEIAVMVEKVEDKFSLSKSYRDFTKWLTGSDVPWERTDNSKISRFKEVESHTSKKYITDYDFNVHRFTEVESRILKKYITDFKLFDSLALIRRVTEIIWASDSPRIVHGYIDHGFEHNLRIAVFIEKLLQVNPHMIFSEQETYLLLAGVYLHDIGIQCDIVKYPEIKKKAEELGAIFKEPFTAKTANSYSIEEQKEILKNHNYLSAAWIDYFYEKEDEMLHPVIKSIPNHLVEDLMDVCKFHSNLPINYCDDTFKFNPSGRKRMVVAVLRFADELDINSTSVNIETVKMFSLNPENSIYSWLHNYTKIDFVDSNMICIKVYLHPEDLNLYGSLIYEDYVTNFRMRNQPILNVLVENMIPVVIDNHSGVVEFKYAEKFPPWITALLNKKILYREKMKNDSTPNLYAKEKLGVIVNNQIQIAKEKGKPFSIIFIDVDDFKRFNTNQYLRDSIIKQIGSLLRNTCRGEDDIIRYGEDKFIIVSTIGTDIEGGYAFAKRIRKEMEENEFSGTDNSGRIRITVSCGVTAYDLNKVYSDDICKQLLFEALSACAKAKKPREDGKVKNFVQVFRHTSN